MDNVWYSRIHQSFCGAYIKMMHFVRPLCAIDKSKQVRKRIHSLSPNSHRDKFLSFHTKTIENNETETSTCDKRQVRLGMYNI